MGGWFTGNALEVYEDPKYWRVSACFVLLTLLNKHQNQPSKQHPKSLCFALVSHRWGLLENPLAPLLCFTLIALFHVDCTVNWLLFVKLTVELVPAVVDAQTYT